MVNKAEVDVFLSIDHMACKAWKCFDFLFTGKLCPPCPRALLLKHGPAALAWPGRLLGTGNLVCTLDLLTQNLQIPGESCSHYSLRSTGLEALLGSSCGCTLPRFRQPERTRRYGHLEPRHLQAVSEHLDPRTLAPSASAGLPPGGHVPAGQVVKIQLFMGWEEGGLNLDLKAGGALA